MRDMMSIGSPAEVCAHALAAENEAVSRYSEFADYLEARGDERTARLFRDIARRNSDRSTEIARRVPRDVQAALPVAEHRWLDDGSGDDEAHRFVCHLMTPYDALSIALSAEEHERAFFAEVAATARDAEAQRVAADIARNDERQIAVIRDALAKVPRPLVHERDFERLLRR